MSKPCVRYAKPIWLTLPVLLLLLPSLQAAPVSLNLQEIRTQADQHFREGRWGEAFDLYGRIPRTERSDEDQQQYRDCLRHVLQARRLRDKPSQDLLGKMPAAQSLRIYKDVLVKLRNWYVDRDKIEFTRLFRNGVLELRFALEDDGFLREQLLLGSPQTLQNLKDYLVRLRDSGPKPVTPDEACTELKNVMMYARGIGLKPAVVMLEFVCGACNALDEYTFFLSPRDLIEHESALNGKYIGIGVDVAVVGEKLFITRVHRDSPAEQQRLLPGDRILRIDGQAVDPQAPAALANRLLGARGTMVNLEIQPNTTDAMLPLPPRVVKVERQPIFVPSVETFYEWKDPMRDHTGIGYIKLGSFQQTTLEELKDAIFKLEAQLPEGMLLKALVIDLRGNLGGAFHSARQVVELFLPEGVVVYVNMRHKKETFQADNPQAFRMPLVLLVDGETASSAEVVAGALKEHDRAVLVGQPTYGKCSIQHVVRLDDLQSGIHITVARFSSPTHLSYDGEGVAPHRYVERGSLMTDEPREVAFKVAEELTQMLMPQ